MNTQIRVLLVEDSEDDALLVVRELEKGGYTVESQRVETPKEMSAALKKQTWNIVLSDFRMPRFNGLDALNLLKETKLDIPFIIVSGKIGEETAVELMLAGADDYVMKTNLKRLVTAVQREMREAEVHRERQRAEAQIVSQSRFISENPNPVLRVNREGIILSHNKASLPLLRYWQTEIGKPLPKDWCRLVEVVYKNEIIKTTEAKHEDKVYLLNFVPIKDNDYVNIYATEITDLKSAEAWIQHLNQVLLTIRKVNQLIVATDDEKELLQKACDIIVESRNYSLVRIGLTIEGSFDIRLAAQRGFAKGCLADIKVTWDDSEYGQGPTGKVIKTGEIVVIGDVTTDESFRPWRDAAIKYGFNSLCALPLTIGKKVNGALVIYNAQKDAFSNDEIELLKELAGDISLGIQKIRQQNEIRQTHEKYAALVENSNDGIVILQDARVKFSNANMGKMTGYAISEQLGKPFIDFVSPGYRELVIERYKKRLAGETVPSGYEIELITKDNKSLPVEISASSIEYEGKPADMAIIRDITERKQAEEALKESQLRLEEAHRLAHIGIWNWDAAADKVVWSKELYEIAGLNPGLPAPTYAEHPKVYTPDSFTRLSKAVEEALQTGKVYELELELVRPDGTHRWVYAFGGPKYGGNGKAVGLHGTVQDITELKQAEEALREGEAKYHAIFEEALDGIVLIDADTDHVVSCNPEYEKLTGRTLEQLQQMNIWEIRPPEHIEAAKQFIHEIKKKGYGSRSELPFQKPDGTIVPVESKARIITLGGKEYVQSITRDITERRKAETEIKFRAELLNAANDSILVLGEKGKIIYFNEAAHQSRGYTREEMTGKKLRDLVSPEFFPLISSQVDKMLKGEGETTFETADLREDNSTIPVEVHSRLIRLDGQEYILNISRDITERKQAEETLRESEAKYRAIFEEALDGIVLIDTETDQIVSCNPAYERLTGRTLAQLQKIKVWETGPPERIENVKRLKQEIKEKGYISRSETPVRRPDGTIVMIESNPRTITLGGKEYVQVITRDISERKQAEERLRESERQLKAAQVLGKIGSWEAEVATQQAIWSDEMFELFERDKTLGPPTLEELRALYFPEENLKFNEAFQLATETGQVSYVDHIVHLPNGKTVFFHTILSPVKDEKGRVVKLFGIMQDITERKLAEEELQKSYAKLQNILDGIINTMAAMIEIRDPYTSGHQRQVAELARAIAREEGLPEKKANDIYTTALIHDIGKMGIPADILSKPGKLSDVEFALIKVHPQIGFDVLKNIGFSFPLAEWVLQHHERLDGSGYPAGLTGDKTTTEAKILAVADVVESMISHRPYRAGLGVKAALEEIGREKGNLYDAAAVDACVRLFKEKRFKFK